MTAPKSFEQYFQSKLPPWLAGTWGNAFAGTFGYVFDKALQGIKQAQQSGFVAVAPLDAVPLHANDRQIEQLDTESVEGLRSRVQAAWDIWSVEGSELSLTQTLALHTNCTALKVYTPAFDSWQTDPLSNGLWSRFWIVIPQPHTWVIPVIGPGLIVGAGLILGLSMTATELRRIRRVAKLHKPGHMVGAEVIVILDATSAAAILANINATTSIVRIPLQWPLVGYQVLVGPQTILGREFS